MGDARFVNDKSEVCSTKCFVLSIIKSTPTASGRVENAKTAFRVHVESTTAKSPAVKVDESLIDKSRSVLRAFRISGANLPLF